LSFLNVLGNLSLVLGLVAIFYDGLSHGHHKGFSLWPSAAPAAATAGGKGKKVRKQDACMHACMQPYLSIAGPSTNTNTINIAQPTRWRPGGARPSTG